MIFIDTDILIDVLRNYKPSLEWFEFQNDELFISGFSYFEVIDGCKDKSSLQKSKSILNKCSIVWLDHQNINTSIETFESEKFNTGIGYIDCLIGHTALAMNIPIYSFNSKHYKAIKGLKVIQPYKRN